MSVSCACSQILRAVVKDMHRRIEMVPSTFVCTDNASRRREIVTNEFQKIVLGRGAEGLCLKKAGSPYQVGERNDRWVKLKPEYFKGGPQDMDFLIVAGYFGEGRVRRDDGGGGGGREQACACVRNLCDTRSACCGCISADRATCRTFCLPSLTKAARMRMTCQQSFTPLPRCACCC